MDILVHYGIIYHIQHPCLLLSYINIIMYASNKYQRYNKN